MASSHTSTTLAGQAAVVSRPIRPSTNRLLVWARGGSPAATYAYQTEIVYGTDVAPGVTWNQFHEPLRILIDALVEHGYVVVTAPLLDGSLIGTAAQGGEFGNDVSATLLRDVIAAARALPDVSSGKFGILTFSMGCMTTANYVRLYGQTDLAGILSFCPGILISSDFRGTDAAPGTYYAAVNLAHGIGGAGGTSVPCDAAWNAIAAVKEPKSVAPSVTVPWGLWTNDNDGSARPVGADEMNALLSAQYRNRRAMGNGSVAGTINGHDYSRIVASDVLDYLSTWNWG